MKTKKFWALFLALVMALSMAVPAFASEEDHSKLETTLAATQFEGVIEVSLPEASTPVVLNPYQILAHTPVNGDDEGAVATTSYRQIFSPAMMVTNLSTYALAVDATITGTATAANSGITFVSAAPAATETAKKVFMWAEFATTATVDEPVWTGVYNNKAANQAVLVDSASVGESDVKKGVATLPATPGNPGDENEDELSPNYLWFKMSGAMAKAAEWVSTDTVSVGVALSFRPVAAEAYPVTVTSKASGAYDGTYTLDYDFAPAGTTITLTVHPNDGSKGEVSFTTPKNYESTPGDNGTTTFTMPASAVAITITWSKAGS